MPAASPSVSVRMYRGLLGDFFLLRHTRHRDDGTPDHYHALIDCGVLQRIGALEDKRSTQRGLDRIDIAIDDLAKAIATDQGPVLDLVIATHEHYDHLSGFIRRHDVFDGFTIRELWLAWTENRNDALANAIRENGKKALSALKTVVKQSGLALDGDDEAADRIRAIDDLLQFYDDDIQPWRLAAAPVERPPYDPTTKPLSCANVITWLKHKVGDAQVKYLEPGEIIAFGHDKALNAHVLGPPRTADRLLKLNPTEGAGKEVYLAKPDDVRALESALRFKGLFPAAPAGAEDIGQPPGADHPFSERFRRGNPDPAKCPIAELYDYKPARERRIDGEWLGTAEMLALKVDSDVNNTSLALAVEVPGGHVLLFPADAQVGNWLSWHDQRYPAKPAKAADPTVSAEDLLARTVLYKVGHHGSHNATARAKGLELMTSPHLVAMIPVVVETAQEQKTRHNEEGWAMPYGDLHKRLKEKTRDRIVQGDGPPTDEAARFTAAGSIFTPAYADATADPLWVELSMVVGPA